MPDNEAHQHGAHITPLEPLRASTPTPSTPRAGERESIRFRARRAAQTNTEREVDVRDVWPFGEMSPAAIAEVMRVSIVTARRWRRKRCLPSRLRPLARLLLDGDLSVISPVWGGWSLRKGELHSPCYTRPFTVADMEYYSFVVGRLSTLELAVQRLEHENKRLRQALSTKAAAHVEERAEQRATLKAIGGAELLMAMAMKLRDELERQDIGDGTARLAVLGTAEMVCSLYQRTDPGTGEPYLVNTSATSAPGEGGDDEPSTALRLVEPPSAAGCWFVSVARHAG
ncbi:MAG: hypothetical protein ACRET2_13345 [Steroidobacteraceae bacterium]